MNYLVSSIKLNQFFLSLTVSIVATMELAHAKTYDEVLSYFSSDSERGLTEDQVRRNQEKYGLNGLYIE